MGLSLPKSNLIFCKKCLDKWVHFNMLVDRIRNLNINTKKNRKQHIDQIKRQVKDTDIKIANGICPKCGGLLVKRNGKYGTFMGYSNYLRCKNTKKI